MPNSEDQMDQSVSPINQEIIDDLYDKYCADPLSVPEDWREYFSALEARNEQIKEPDPQEKQPHKVTGTGLAVSARDVTRSDLPPAPPVAASEPTSPYVARKTALDLGPAGDSDEEDTVERLRGVAKAVVKNMDESLQIPTATSAREIPAKLLIENRKVINTHLAATTGGKVSFTHLIGYAIIEALVEMPSMNVRFEKDEDGHGCIRKFAHVGFGLAIDLPKEDGSRSLMVPVVHKADTLNFRQFIDAYEDLVKRARAGSLKPADFAGGTVTLTNPGTLGTKQSVPRLMTGQGAIIGVGATSFPAEWAGASPSQLANAGIGQIMTMTSTYDHRVIQGAGSGEFLRIIEQKLTGHDGFFERVFSTLGVAHAPYQWERDFNYDQVTEKGKPARIAELIHAYRSRGHLAANTDPLQQILRRHPDLSIGSYGLSVWDLDRVFPTGGFAGRDTMNLRDLLEQLRATYTQAIGIEYMHIQDPVQRRWVQSRIEKPTKKLSKDEQMHVLSMLNHAEAFETFLQTKYVGQKRFSLEGAESLIPLLDKMLSSASRTGVKEITIGMAHRGRLNVLSNVAGKSYGQIFSEFEGYLDPNSTQGSGDVKYHLGTEGIYSADEGEGVLVSLTANPSHLEAANGVTEGITRAKQDRLGGGKDAESQVMPILIHGDAAFIGEGVVQETLNMSQLRGYRTGGTVHIIVNNQIGFTTGPTSGRSTRYCTDLAKGLQVPIFHVNGDYPQDVVKAAKLAFDFRQEFHKDVIIDMVCYRRRGHNEGDDPSMTQPVLYSLIDSLPTTREVYTRNLIGRGDLSEEKAQEALQEYHDDLNKIFQETREKKEFDAAEHDDTTNPGGDTRWVMPTSQQPGQGMMLGWTSAITREEVERIGQSQVRVPQNFTPHPKIMKVLQKREVMSREGKIDWGMGEMLAYGSLVMEGTNVRLGGQDSRRGTFSHRHAVIHDYENGREWTPLNFLTEEQATFQAFNSPLSEYAPLAFEYGYSVESPETLVLWEAQFGDFANCGQAVTDEFVSSSFQKWNERSGVVMLLPHGYEGQGPDHSSARIERYLQLCAQENMWVCQPSNPANNFHMLRAQAYKRPRKPLIAFEPKQLLRLAAAASPVEDFISGEFKPVIGEVDERVSQPSRVLLCSGRVYYDLVKERAKCERFDTAIVRLEQLYPLPAAELQEVLNTWGDLPLTWVQDEPENQGPWPFMALHLPGAIGKTLQVASRPEAASPAAGNSKLHKAENAELMEKAFA